MHATRIRTYDREDAGLAPGAIAHAILRIGLGLLLLQHGVQKLFGWLGGAGQSGEAAELFSLYGLAGVIETIGGSLIVLGLLTRPVAAILCLEMVVAYFMAHQPRAPWPILNGGEPALLLALGFLFLAASGAGPFSVDRSLERRRAGEESAEADARTRTAA